MGQWPWWLTWVLIAAALGALLIGLDRLCRSLPGPGWLYSRGQGTGSSPLGAFVAFQQFIEPGVRHVHEIREQRREADEAATRAGLLARLLHLLDATPVNAEEVRLCLAAAAAAGLDWRELYAEATQIQRAVRPEGGDLPPSPEDLAPCPRGPRPQR